MGCKMSKRKGARKQLQKEDDAIHQPPESIGDLETFKRAQLQKLCKRYKLKANGKNTELVSRLKKHFETTKQQDQLSNNNVSPCPPPAELVTNFTPLHGEHIDPSPTHLQLEEQAISDSPSPPSPEEQASIPTPLHPPLEERAIPPHPSPEKKAISDSPSPPSPEERAIPPHLSPEEQAIVSTPLHRPHGDVLNESAPQNEVQLDRCTKEPNQEPKQDDPTNRQRKWCVVEGAYMNCRGKIHWRKIVLCGGRPMVPNRFGKLIPFMLEPSLTEVPAKIQDNMICGTCVMKNEEVVYSKDSDFRTRKQRQKYSHETISPLQDITNVKYGKRKGDRQMESDRKNKSRRSSSNLSCQEDPDFAKRVEAIMNRATPGSEEERLLVMRATRSYVQHSPAKV